MTQKIYFIIVLCYIMFFYYVTLFFHYFIILYFDFVLQKTDDEDSGNNEPLDLYYNADRRASQQQLNSSQNSSPLVSSPSDVSDHNGVPYPYLQPLNCQAARSDPELNDDLNCYGHGDPPINNHDPNPLDLNLQDVGDHLRNENYQMQGVENLQQHDVLEEDLQSPEDLVSADEDAENFENAVLFHPRRNYGPYPEAGEPSRPRNLTDRLEMLANYKHIEHESVSEPGFVERLPPEVLLAVFSHLDDVSLWCAANVCRRWCGLLSTHVTPQQWQQHVKLRWPLFRSDGTVTDWYKVYDELASSAPCKTCLAQTCLRSRPLKPLRMEENSWRRNRLRIELKGLRIDPPEGIQATPLDVMSCHWQATITGPAGSPYEGGLFYLYLQVPYR